MGLVYEAYDHVRDMSVALKVLRSVAPSAIYRFKREFRAINRLNHPNLVGLYELFTDSGQWFLAMELVRGTDFMRHILRSDRPDRKWSGSPVATQTSPAAGQDGENSISDQSATAATLTSSADSYSSPDTQTNVPEHGGITQPFLPHAPAELVAVGDFVDLDRLTDCLGQLASALAMLHAADVVHRDLKPSNVLVTEDGRLVLLDFGIITELSRRRHAHSLAGTPLFMAPEQLTHRAITTAVDVYAFGTMVYMALTGRRPFYGTIPNLARVKSTVDPIPPSALSSGIPAALETLCLQCLSRDPGQRPTAAQIVERLGTSHWKHAVISVARDRESHHFVGRGAELEALRDAYRQTSSGDTPFCVIVRGVAGIGKTTLVDRFLAENNHALILSGRSHEREEISFKALDELIDELARHLSMHPDERRRALIPEHFNALVQLFPVLGQLLDNNPAGQTSSVPGDVRSSAVAALRQLMTSLAGERPLILRSEDFQWADRDSLELMAEFLRWPAPPGMLVILTMRSETPHDEDRACRLKDAITAFQSQLPCRIIDVGPLSDCEQNQLIAELVTDPGVAERLHQIAVEEVHGHPMLIAELSRLGSTAAQVVAGECKLVLEDILWQRIEQLTGPERDLVEVLSLAGEPLPEFILARTAAVTGSDARRLIASLTSAQLARSSRLRGHSHTEIYHDKIREAVVARVPAVRARMRHRRLAETLTEWDQASDALRARHWYAAGDEERAAIHLLRAASSAAEQFASARALDFYDQVLALIPTVCVEPDDALRRCEALFGKAQVMRTLDHIHEALAVLDEAIPIADAHQLWDQATTIYGLRGNLYYVLGDSESCMNSHRRVLDYARQLGSPPREAQALSGLCDAYTTRGQGIQAREYARQGIALSRKHGLTRWEAIHLQMYGVMCYICNEFTDAKRNQLDALALATGENDKRMTMIIHHMLGALCWDMGAFESFLHHLEQMSQFAEQIGSPRFLALNWILRVKAEMTLRRPERALSLAEKADEIYRRHPGLAAERPLALTAFITVTHDRDEQRRIAREAEAMMRNRSNLMPYLWFYRDAIEAALDIADWTAVDHLTHGLEQYIAVEPLPWSQFLIRWSRVLAAYGQSRDESRRAALAFEIRQLLAFARRLRHHRVANILVRALQGPPPWCALAFSPLDHEEATDNNSSLTSPT